MKLKPKPEDSLEDRYLRHHAQCGGKTKAVSTQGLRASNMLRASYGIKCMPQKPSGEESVSFFKCVKCVMGFLSGLRNVDTCDRVLC